jgi:hypothetical protein
MSVSGTVENVGFRCGVTGLGSWRGVHGWLSFPCSWMRKRRPRFVRSGIFIHLCVAECHRMVSASTKSTGPWVGLRPGFLSWAASKGL